ncbi:hypothetical protein [Arthrobacter sp. PsM3]|uniref:hypothetical protein n=1 Tax=Arthrobacter sp. PsM3 TaxID=3030531 RepID=UPI00263B5F96|nr:hypothetical protein [Arthrobacter sp. PsM3]MDN4644928.1 hypothetical protein [Arthrobacter sp. PsM3]
MSRTLNAHVTLWGPDGALASLAPGDELPDWAEGKVGDHCLVPDSPADALVPDADEDSEVDSDLDPETESDESERDDEEPEALDAVPNFTAAAPRRGRTRK